VKRRAVEGEIHMLKADHARDLNVCSARGCERAATWVSACPDCDELVAGCAVHVLPVMLRPGGPN
jgi:ribosomal protein L37AE/L43A